MKLKKIFSLLLVLTLVLSLTTSAVFADGWGKDKTKIPPGLAKKLFDDTGKFPWAEQAIEKMFLKGLIKGYGEGMFKPQGEVTKLEVIIMALRVMGWEDEALKETKLPKNYKGAKVDGWAVGYVALAYEKGILDDVDMMYFNPMDPALRHEVAKYVIRALRFEEDAQDAMDEDLDFVDESAIPQGSIGYVYLVDEMELMQGDNQKRFNPMGTMTRAEMAVLFSRIDDKVDSDVDDEVIGKVVEVDDDEIVLKIDNKQETYDVDEDVRVYEDGKRIDYDEIEKDLTVKLEIEDDVVVYIEVLEDEDVDKIITRYTGEVNEIKTTRPMRIAIQNLEMILMFEVIDDVEVEFDNDEGDFDEIVEGDDVTIVVDNRNRAREIEVHRNRTGNGWDDEVEGEITALDLSGSYHISIDDEEYDLAEDADVEIDGDESELDKLVVGMEAKIKIEDGIVEYIEAESIEDEVEGIFVEVDDDEIIVEVDGDEEEYQLADNVRVDIKGYTDRLSQLVPGMLIELKLNNNEVYEIYAEDNKFTLEGEIEEITDDTITIEVDDEDYLYYVSDDVEIEIEGERNPNFEDLDEGDEGEFEIVNNIIVKISIED